MPPDQTPDQTRGPAVSGARAAARAASSRPAGIPASAMLAVIALALACAVPELVLLGADRGFWGSSSWRPLAYAQGAFWPGLLYGWTANYAAQPWVMFLTYAWLHAGPGHLLGNLAALLWLGPRVAGRRGAAGLVVLWIAAAVGGAVAFALLTTGAAPMVGASGAIFGLAADWLVAEVRAVRGVRARTRRAAAILTLLAALNAAGWVLLGDGLAWQAHLGGFLAGLVLAVTGRSVPGLTNAADFR